MYRADSLRQSTPGLSPPTSLDSELTPCTANCLKINRKRCKGDMRTSIGSFFLSPSSGDGSAHADRLHLSAWLCDHGLSRHAHGVARSHRLICCWLLCMQAVSPGCKTLEEMA